MEANLDNIFCALSDNSDYRKLRQAATDGNVQHVEEAVKTGIDINALYGDGQEGRRVLHMAASTGHVDVIRGLLANGADINGCDLDRAGNSTPLFKAALCTRVEATRALITAGANIHARGFENGTALNAVLWTKTKIQQSHIDIICLLLDHGADVNSEASECGGTVLQQAVEIGHHDLIKFLFDKGASLDGSLALAACLHETTNTVKFLINLGARDDKASALVRAAHSNKMDSVRVLLSRGGSSKASPSEKAEALTLAAIRRHLDIVRYLLEQGFDVNTKDVSGRTALDAACDADKPPLNVIQTLLDHGADISVQDKKVPQKPYKGGGKPLYTSAWRSHPEVVRLLLDAGVNINAINDAGETPLIKFSSCGSCHAIRKEGISPRIEAMTLLIDAGSDINAKDAKGRTALHSLTARHRYDSHKNKLNGARLPLAGGIDVWARDEEGKTAADLLDPKAAELDPEFTELAQLLAASMSNVCNIEEGSRNRYAPSVRERPGYACRLYKK